LYGVRDQENNFDPERYKKVMRFCKMTEVKIAQGAKQTGGKIVAAKVTEDIAYYRGVEPGKDLISPNRFPYAKTTDELFDFIGSLQDLSEKPVGMKIVVSDANDTDLMIVTMKERFDQGKSIPDFITIDGGDGGSATAPLELMEAVGLDAVNGLFILDTMLKKHGMREQVRLVASGKILTPDDVAILLCMGADMVGIARGFMMSGGCIRARHCSGADGKKCPIGMATQDKKKRLSYLVIQKSKHIANYHSSLIKGVKTVMAVMGVAEVNKLSKKNVAFKNKQGDIFFNVDDYYHKKLNL
jgi:glutamate synthase domain-containing protein 2